MMHLTEREYEMMLRFREAIDLFCDNGKWERRDGELVFVVDEDTTDRILILIDDAQEIDDDDID